MKKMYNYGQLPKEYADVNKAKIVMIPVAYDRTSTWIKGADKGPMAIIEASANLELYDMETRSEVYKQGIYTESFIDEGLSSIEMITAVQGKVKYHLGQDKFPVVLGGEHSVSIGSIKAHAERHNHLTVLQLDAHADLRHEYNGSIYNHACVMARAKEICQIVQVGIRSMDISENNSMDTSRVFPAQDIHSNTDWIHEVIPILSENVYITIDLDVFDPSIMPSTGTPEPGGLLWYDVLALLKTVCNKRTVVGFDVVELCPDEKNKAPDFLAAKLIYVLLSYIFRGDK